MSEIEKVQVPERGLLPKRFIKRVAEVTKPGLSGDEAAMKRARSWIDRRLTNYRLGVAPSVTTTAIGFAVTGLGLTQDSLLISAGFGPGLSLCGVILFLLFVDRTKGYSAALDALDALEMQSALSAHTAGIAPAPTDEIHLHEVRETDPEDTRES